MNEPVPLRISTCLPELVLEDMLAIENHSVTNLYAVHCTSGLRFFEYVIYFTVINCADCWGAVSQRQLKFCVPKLN